jgi:hypothetical protein
VCERERERKRERYILVVVVVVVVVILKQEDTRSTHVYSFHSFHK